MQKPLWHRVAKTVGFLDRCAGNRLLLSLLNNRLKEYGIMTSLVIDSKSKSITLHVELKGEDRPIEIQIRDYTIEAHGAGSRVTLGDISFSREWMNVLARNLLTDRTLALPVAPDLLEQFL